MQRLASRSAWITAGVATLAAGFATDARADQPHLTATMQCERAAEPGRVRCTVEARATGGRTMSWADVVLVDLPELTTALKGRVGPSDVTARDASSRAWAFALVARKQGEGEAHARVRAVLCEPVDAGAPRCRPTTVDVRTTVTVG